MCFSESEDFSLALSVPDLSSDKKLSVVPAFNRLVLKTTITLLWLVLKVCLWECRQCPGVWELNLDTEDEVKVPESPEDVREAEEARLGPGHSVQRRGELTSHDDDRWSTQITCNDTVTGPRRGAESCKTRESGCFLNFMNLFLLKIVLLFCCLKSFNLFY